MDNENYTQRLSKETITKLTHFYSNMITDPTIQRENVTVFINEVIQILISQALSDYDPKIPKKKQMEKILKNFTYLTSNVQDQVGIAFSRAMHKYAGQDIQYCCLIKRLNDVPSGPPC